MVQSRPKYGFGSKHQKPKKTHWWQLDSIAPQKILLLFCRYEIFFNCRFSNDDDCRHLRFVEAVVAFAFAVINDRNTLLFAAMITLSLAIKIKINQKSGSELQAARQQQPIEWY